MREPHDTYHVASKPTWFSHECISAIICDGKHESRINKKQALLGRPGDHDCPSKVGRDSARVQRIGMKFSDATMLTSAHGTGRLTKVPGMAHVRPQPKFSHPNGIENILIRQVHDTAEEAWG
jgi:hypothetical protein